MKRNSKFLSLILAVMMLLAVLGFPITAAAVSEEAQTPSEENAPVICIPTGAVIHQPDGTYQIVFTTPAIWDEAHKPVKGNVPVTFIPNSTVTYHDDRSYSIAVSISSTPKSQENGIHLAEQTVEPELEATNQAMIEKFKNLPVYTYEDYYIAHEGAAASYDQTGRLIRVRGDCEYYSTLDQYLVDGVLPNGTYIGTYMEFSQIITN